MSNILNSIVLADREIGAVLEARDSFRLQRLSDLYKASYDKEAFVAILSTRLLMEHDRLALSERKPVGELQQAANPTVTF